MLFAKIAKLKLISAYNGDLKVLVSEVYCSAEG